MERSDAYQKLNSREVDIRMRLATPDCRWDNSYESFGPFTGYRDTIGFGRIHNTPLAAMQLSSALAAGSSPGIDDLLKCRPHAYHMADREKARPEIDRIRKAVQAMAREKALGGMKILDIGCGPFPSFARCTRALGAKVYTVDLNMPSTVFWGTDEFKKQHGAEEEAHHMVCDFGAPDADKSIAEWTGGNFDIVTWSHLTSGWKVDRLGAMELRELKSRAMDLLKKNGWLIPLPMEDGLTITQSTNIAP